MLDLAPFVNFLSLISGEMGMPPEVDLSHLSEEERMHIQQVTAKAQMDQVDPQMGYNNQMGNNHMGNNHMGNNHMGNNHMGMNQMGGPNGMGMCDPNMGMGQGGDMGMCNPNMGQGGQGPFPNQ